MLIGITIVRIRTTMWAVALTTVSPQNLKRYSGIAGIYYPALGKIYQYLLFSRRRPKIRSYT